MPALGWRVLTDRVRIPTEAFSTEETGVDYGMYMTGLTDPPAMESFEQEYQRRPISMGEGVSELEELAQAFSTLELQAMYQLDDGGRPVVEATYRHEDKPIVIFRQPKERPIQFTGYETEPVTVDSEQCLMAQNERYCAYTFATAQEQYVVIGERDDPMPEQIVRHLLSR